MLADLLAAHPTLTLERGPVRGCIELGKAGACCRCPFSCVSTLGRSAPTAARFCFRHEATDAEARRDSNRQRPRRGRCGPRSDGGRWLAGLGLAGCLLLAATLPVTGVAVGAAMLAIGATGRMILTRAGHRLP
jgi:hypothetical protein